MPPTIRKRPKRTPRPPTDSSLKGLLRAVVLLTLGAISSPISQATLSPVFGAIPSSINHREAVVASSILGFILKFFFKNPSPRSVAQWTAIWCFWIPVVSNYLFRLSDVLGPIVGPALIGLLSCHTIIMPAAYSAAEALESLNLRASLGPFLGALIPATTGVIYLVSAERWFQAQLPRMVTMQRGFNPIQMQIALALGQAAFIRTQWIILGLPPLLHTGLLNPHFATSITANALNTTLQEHNWTLLDRQWSNTGYISVLENTQLNYRVMRCDHSLLGGEWIVTKDRRSRGWQVNEPIYAVFEMMEAVRLMELDPPIVDTRTAALVIGLGIGTAPKAFISHGINTTVIELDKTVHAYATKYFGMPSSHTAVFADAVHWTHLAVQGKKLKYDYILHDVFTGGAEPLPLFTETFLRNLRSLLKPNGAISLNYAGDLNVPLTRTVLNTIDKVFDGQCKIYREAPPEPPSPEDANDADEDFTNMVIFCCNTPGPITFREPVDADFLGSQSRQQYLYPDPDFEIQFPLRGAGNRTQALESHILRSGEEHLWSKQQAESAIKHWHIMRKVVPSIVWELW